MTTTLASAKMRWPNFYQGTLGRDNIDTNNRFKASGQTLSKRTTDGRDSP
ncbi:MAG: hypothetical protein HOH70_06280 [Halieaceae bacterium]|nr:hypothetical protein [Halieaceae bacterium]